MKRLLGLAIGLFLVIGFTSSAEAIRIKIAEVQNRVAFIKGGDAEKRAPVTWEGQLVTSANPGGEFSFNGVVPADCVGTLSDGVSTIAVAVLDCTAVSAAPAPVPRTGQTTTYAAGDDGALQKGVAWPTPRFTDNNNGTITDNLTGLIWLKDANCPGIGRVWQTALDDVAQLNTDGTMNSNNCGDTSNVGSHQTDWRLPNRNELTSLLDLGTQTPALPARHPFMNVVPFSYYSSTTVADQASAWLVDFGTGFVFHLPKMDGNLGFVIAVRGGS